MKKILSLIIISIAICLFCNVALALDVPKYTDWVNDFANVIDDSVENSINQTLDDYEKKTSNEITVITIPSLEGDNLEGFSMKLAEDWKVGKKDKDNGIILLFAIQDKKVRLEVGYGLEGIINDAKAGRILDDHVVQYRDEGDYTKAAKNGVYGIIGAIGEEPWTEEQAGEEPSLAFVIIFFVIIFGMIILISWFSNDDGSYNGIRFGGGSSGGSSSGGGFGGFGGGSFGGGGAYR